MSDTIKKFIDEVFDCEECEKTQSSIRLCFSHSDRWESHHTYAVATHDKVRELMSPSSP